MGFTQYLPYGNGSPGSPMPLESVPYTGEPPQPGQGGSTAPAVSTPVTAPSNGGTTQAATQAAQAASDSGAAPELDGLGAPAPPPKLSKGGYAEPGKTSISYIKSRLLQPALTSHYQCWFNPPNFGDPTNKTKKGLRDWIKERGLIYNDELISLSCTEAVLPGSSLMTNEINDDFTGVTERHAYRRQYDDRADFTFYVPKENYYIIKFFEYWLSYIAGEDLMDSKEALDSKTYSYRINYPEFYQSQSLYVIKFEKDYMGRYLEYRLLQAYPISISSMPVSYDSSQLLKCTVSFTYTRYIVDTYDFKPKSKAQTGFFEEISLRGNTPPPGGWITEVAPPAGIPSVPAPSSSSGFRAPVPVPAPLPPGR